jgi:hypothetical protein
MEDDELPFDPYDDDFNLLDEDFDEEPLEYDGPYAGEGGIDF